MLTVKVTPKTYAEFQAACEMRAIKMATQLHIFMVKMILEEQTRDPGTFGVAYSQAFQEVQARRIKKEERRTLRLIAGSEDNGEPSGGQRLLPESTSS